MIYNVYKNCDDNCFKGLKTRLASLKDNILNQFKSVLIAQSRADDSDYLGLNFEIKGSDIFGSNITILYEDLPQKKTFQLGLVKTYDDNNYRYSIKKQIMKNVPLEFIESNYSTIISDAVQQFNSISKEEILQGNKIELPR